MKERWEEAIGRNPRYRSYASMNGREPADQMHADRRRWPGGVMTGFIIWISQHWQRWDELHRHPKHHVRSDEEQDRFTRWLQQQYQPETKEDTTMKLMTAEIAKALPKLYSTEEIPGHEKVAVAKWFAAGRWTWYAVEGQPLCLCKDTGKAKVEHTAETCPDPDWEFFGYVVSGLGPDCDEWGSFTLSQLESISGYKTHKLGENTFGMTGGLERDKFWKPKKMGDVIPSLVPPPEEVPETDPDGYRQGDASPEVIDAHRAAAAVLPKDRKVGGEIPWKAFLGGPGLDGLGKTYEVEVKARTLDDVFAMLNRGSGSEIAFEGPSLSVGDVVQNMVSGCKFRCAPDGWDLLKDSDVIASSFRTVEKADAEAKASKPPPEADLPFVK